jgi:2-polyprenyl-3-methyl-5-hydroxy-6-metoxy-1,4-benzoquinol methylase
MKKDSAYQYPFSERLHRQMYDQRGRERKAKTMVAVLSDFLQTDLGLLSVLDVGSSTGIITNYLAKNFRSVMGIDIDAPAVAFAKKKFKKKNLEFIKANSLQMDFAEKTFDVVICAHIYEHVPHANRLMAEIYRVLKTGGICYFAAGNRLRIKEPHYDLAFLSTIPRPLAHAYLRIAGKGRFYDERHLSYWGLKKLVRRFEQIDYTKKIIRHPASFDAEYMIRPHTRKAKLARFIVNYAYWLCPTYIWLLRK